MDLIDHTEFGGMIPAVSDAHNLPFEAAQLAENVDLRSGKLQPLKVTEKFTAMHSTDDYLLIPGIPLSDIRSITQPVAPSENTRIRQCIPAVADSYIAQWLAMNVRLWESHLEDDGTYEENSIEYYAAVNKSFEYTEDGFVLWATVESQSHTFDTDRLYTLYGPNYVVVYSSDNAFKGGPETGGYIPAVSSAHDDPLPVFSLPLTTPFPDGYDSYPTGPETDRYVYGYLTLEDVGGPAIPKTLYFDSDDYEGAASIAYKLHSAQYVSFRFSCNFVQPRRKYYNYAQSMVDQRVVAGELTGALTGAITSVVLDTAAYGSNSDVSDTGYVLLDNGSDTPELVAYTAKSYNVSTATWTLTVSTTLTYSYAEDDTATIIDPTIVGKEGPPSELSDRIQVMPGEVVQISCARSNGYTRNYLYRTEDSKVDPSVLETVDADTYWDTGFVGLGDTLPPFGNYPNATLADARARSVMHPNNFGVISDGKVLRLSDIERPWVYPEEYAIEYLTTILANPIVGRSIIVFTEGDEDAEIPGYVYRVGGYRDQTSSDELTDARPLQNVLSLCKIDGSLFYVSKDGLMEVSEGGVRNASEAWFTKQEWNEHSNALMRSYVNDGVIYLLINDEVNYRMDLDRGIAAVTRFTDLPTARNQGVPMTWTSKIFTMATLTRHAYVRVRAAGYPVLFQIYSGDGVLRSEMKLPSDTKHRLPRCKLYREMYYTVRSNYRIDQVTVATTAQMLDRVAAEG